MNFSLKHLLKIFNLIFAFLDNHAAHHVAEVEEIIYVAGALVRYLPPYSPDFNAIQGSYHPAKDFIRENDNAFRCCLQPLRLSCMLLRKFHKKTAKGMSETVALSDFCQIEVINLSPFVKCAEPYSAELQNYVLLF